MVRTVRTTANRDLPLRRAPSALFYLLVFATFLSLPEPCALNAADMVTELCDGAVETAAHLIFQDGVERYFVSNGPYYWFLNVSSDIPDVQSALKIPYGFQPDVAILKNTTSCHAGHLSLVLIQMKPTGDSNNEAEWLTLEMTIGKWSDNETEPIFWNKVNRIAYCDLDAQVCTTTDNYFVTMSFDFKRKLNAAFGTIGETAYFVQGQSLYKVIYKEQCVSNPYSEVIAYPAVPMGTTTTAALSIPGEQSIVFFDNDVHLVLTNTSSVDDVSLHRQLADVAKWQDNAHYFFKQCPLVESAFSFLLMDVFSNSKKHFVKKQIILVSASLVLLTIAILVLAVVGYSHVKKARQRKEQSAGGETNEEQLIEQPLDVQIKSNETNGEQQKTLLQTSC